MPLIDIFSLPIHAYLENYDYDQVIAVCIQYKNTCFNILRYRLKKDDDCSAHVFPFIEGIVNNTHPKKSFVLLLN